MSASAFKKFLMLSALCGSVFTLSACSDTREMLGLEKTAPDEFAVYSRAPLSLPPDYKLRPPTPGADRPQGEDETVKARRALTGRNAITKADPLAEYQSMTPGLKSLLQNTGALNADPDIRRTIDRETSAFIAESETFIDDILSWSGEEKFGTIVDSAKEAQRIREAQALGQTVDGAGTISINKEEKRLLDTLLGR